MTGPSAAELLHLVDRAEAGRLLPAEARLLRDGITALAGAVAEIRALHVPMLRGAVTCCAECSGWDGRRCRGAITAWPCDTATALTPTTTEETR